jgi:hypothetical protein
MALETLPTVFDPVSYSVEGNAWLIAHIGESSQQATLTGVPPGVDRATIAALDDLYRLDQAAQATGGTWVGFEAIRAAARTYLVQLQQWEANYQRQRSRDPNYPRYPSLCTWDSFGRYHKGGVGSDSGRVATYFDEQGSRQRFALELQPETRGAEEVPTWLRGKRKAQEFTEIIENDTIGYFECPICQVRESYEAMSAASRNGARAKLGKHLTNARTEKDAHKALHTLAFGSH